MNDDQQLIEDVRISYKAKDLKELSEEINIPYITLLKWNSGGISNSGTGRQYLQALLKIKELEQEKLMYKNFFDSFKTILDHKEKLDFIDGKK